MHTFSIDQTFLKMYEALKIGVMSMLNKSLCIHEVLLSTATTAKTVYNNKNNTIIPNTFET